MRAKIDPHHYLAIDVAKSPLQATVFKASKKERKFETGDCESL